MSLKKDIHSERKVDFAVSLLINLIAKTL